jgi:RNA polymerase sigma-70 factor (ECF subfamily)
MGHVMLILTAFATTRFLTDDGRVTHESNPGLVEIRRIARGDKQALAALYEQYASHMLALGVRMMRNPREAEDILHDVVLQVWKRAGDYDPRRGTVKTWLLLHMRSRCLDRLKSAGYSRSTGLEHEGALHGATSGHNPEQLADGARVRQLLTALPEEQAQVLVLGYYEGMSSSQIAESLGIPIGTVKSRVSAALSKMRTLLRVSSEGQA